MEDLIIIFSMSFLSVWWFSYGVNWLWTDKLRIKKVDEDWLFNGERICFEGGKSKKCRERMKLCEFLGRKIGHMEWQRINMKIWQHVKYGRWHNKLGWIRHKWNMNDKIQVLWFPRLFSSFSCLLILQIALAYKYYANSLTFGSYSSGSWMFINYGIIN